MTKDNEVMKKEILTMEEVCCFLQLSRNTVAKMIKDGTIVARTFGRQYRIRKSDILGMFDANNGDDKR